MARCCFVSFYSLSALFLVSCFVDIVFCINFLERLTVSFLFLGLWYFCPLRVLILLWECWVQLGFVPDDHVILYWGICLCVSIFCALCVRFRRWVSVLIERLITYCTSLSTVMYSRNYWLLSKIILLQKVGNAWTPFFKNMLLKRVGLSKLVHLGETHG